MQNFNGSRPIHDMYEGLAIAYVKNQPPGSPTYDLANALTKGTVYPCLDKPFVGKGGCCR